MYLLELKDSNFFLAKKILDSSMTKIRIFIEL